MTAGDGKFNMLPAPAIGRSRKIRCGYLQNQPEFSCNRFGTVNPSRAFNPWRRYVLTQYFQSQRFIYSVACARPLPAPPLTQLTGYLTLW